MRAKIQTLIVVIVYFCNAPLAFCQTNPNGLAISAEASLLTSTNEPKLFLMIHLVNTTNHAITVLTKNLNWSFNGNPNSDGKPTLECNLGYSGVITHEGHQIVPALGDFSPVTLRPNEAAVITYELERSRRLKQITAESPITVKYEISPDWAGRFALWNGSVTTKPFNASVRKTR